MTEIQKSIIFALRSAGVPFAEIAEQLDLSVNTIKSSGATDLCRGAVRSYHRKPAGI